MADRGRGGYRAPARPAAVSNPQSGRRTDGGPADKQPIRTPTGGAYGEAAAMAAQQGAAPMVSGAPPQGGEGAAVAGIPGMPQGPVDAFAPTQRMGEPATMGIPGTGSQQIPDADMILRAIYQRYPSPWIAGLLS